MKTTNWTRCEELGFGERINTYHFDTVTYTIGYRMDLKKNTFAYTVTREKHPYRDGFLSHDALADDIVAAVEAKSFPSGEWQVALLNKLDMIAEAEHILKRASEFVRVNKMTVEDATKVSMRVTDKAVHATLLTEHNQDKTHD